MTGDGTCDIFKERESLISEANGCKGDEKFRNETLIKYVR